MCFKDHLNKFILPKGNSCFGICDKFGIKLLTKIRVDFSDLSVHRFNHNFNCESPTGFCGARRKHWCITSHAALATVNKELTSLAKHLKL